MEIACIFILIHYFSTMTSLCPCNSGKAFTDCCDPIIKNQSATTAEALMRSRYTAYCIDKADYLLGTAHPQYRKDQTIEGISSWSAENKWIKLEIVDTESGEVNDTEGSVEFKAHFIDKNGLDQIHHEKSDFVKENNHWYYTTGVFNPEKPNVKVSISRNAPCPCGSGKKYKKCCG